MLTVETDMIEGWNPLKRSSGEIVTSEFAVMLVVKERSRTSSAEMSDVDTTAGNTPRSLRTSATTSEVEITATGNARCLTSEAAITEDAVMVGEIAPMRVTRAATIVDVAAIASTLKTRCAPNTTVKSEVATADAERALSRTIDADTADVAEIGATGMNLSPTSGSDMLDVAEIEATKCLIRANSALTSDVAAIKGTNLRVLTIETVIAEFPVIDGKTRLMPVSASVNVDIATMLGLTEISLTTDAVMSDLACNPGTKRRTRWMLAAI